MNVKSNKKEKIAEIQPIQITQYKILNNHQTEVPTGLETNLERRYYE